MQRISEDIVSNPKTATAVSSVVTTAAGAATTNNIIPWEVGTIASIVGIISTLILLTLAIRRHRLEVRLLKQKLGEYDES
jgi:threonine/homoserine/homoserine lactone efflux protein